MRRLCFAVTISLSLAQQQPETADTAVFRVNSTLVQIDAVVTDSKGNQVPNLTANDFEVYADGKPQRITHFSYVAVSAPKTAAADSPKNPILAPPPHPVLRRQDVRRTTVLMIDDLNLSFESMATVRRALLKYVDEQMQPGDLVAVCRTGAGESAFQQFTSDRRLVRAVVSRLHWNPSGSFGTSFVPPLSPTGVSFLPDDRSGLPSVNAPTVDAPRMTQLFEALRQNTLSGGTLGSLDYIVQSLRDLPGRKSVVIFSDGLIVDPGDDFTREILHRLIDRANRSGTVLYTIHAAGLQTLQFGAADNGELKQTANGQETLEEARIRRANAMSQRSSDLFEAQAGLEYLARSTGGLSYFNGNDLNYGLSKVLEDQKGYYLLGYSPSSDTFDPQKGGLPYHRLKVLVRDKHLRVRSRTGFFGATDEETKPHYANAFEETRAAMLSPFTSSGVGFRLTPIYADVPGHGPVVRSLMNIDPHDLTFKPNADGALQAKIKLLTAAYGPDNRQINTTGFDYVITIQPGRMDDVMREGILYDLSVPLPKPGGVQIRAAVRDEESHKTGSANEFIDIPDIRKKRFGLTSVVLARAPKSGTIASAFAPSAARRQFHRGDVLQYFSLLENLDPKHATDLHVQIRVVNEDKQIFLEPASLTDLSGNKRAASGLIKLGDQLPNGDYFFQLTAELTQGSKRVTAEQWTTFEVLPEAR